MHYLTGTLYKEIKDWQNKSPNEAAKITAKNCHFKKLCTTFMAVISDIAGSLGALYEILSWLDNIRAKKCIF